MTLKPRHPLPRMSSKKLSEVAPQWSTITTKGKPIKKSNPERQQKVKARQRKKHQAYMRSECRRVVDARAQGQCEKKLDVPSLPHIYDADGWVSDRLPRCPETTGLQHHHFTYARYGGKELPADMIVVCKAHHRYLESLKPAGNRYSRRTT